MSRLILRRVVRLAGVVVLVTFVTYALLDATPGDPAVWKLGNNANPEVLAATRHELGLDRPMVTRYLSWLGNALRFDFGTSLFTGHLVRTLLASALPKTLELMVLAEVMALAGAVPLALRAVRRPGRWLDRISSTVSFAVLALPPFVLALYLTYVFSVRLGWLPTIVTKLPSVWADPLGNLRQLVLPALTLAVPLGAVYLRMLRADLISTLQEDYVLLAKARGLSDRRLMWRHVLRPSSTNLLTAVGMNAAGLIGGAVVVERVFSINGVGHLFIESVVGKEFSTAATIVLLVTIAVAVANFVVDLTYALLDPRIRRGPA